MTIKKHLVEDFCQKHKQFRNLESINIYRKIHEHGDNEYNLDIVLCNALSPNEIHKLFITFRKVRNIKIGDLDGIFALVINIRDISTEQLDSVNFKVYEEEYDTFSFYCESFYCDII